MLTKEVLQEAGILPGILYIGGWGCIGILILLVIYYLLVCFTKSLK